jgi:DNA-binding transcriptional ArsR family regulator
LVINNSQRLDATFAALADPTRRAILARLALGEASVTELAEPFAMTQPAISKHLKVLERAGLISRGRAGSTASRSRRRPDGWKAIAGSGRADSSDWTPCLTSSTLRRKNMDARSDKGDRR